MKLYQEHEQERLGIMAITPLQAAVTFPEVIATALEHADALGRREFAFQLGAENDYAVLIEDEPSAKDWDREADAKVRLADALFQEVV